MAENLWFYGLSRRQRFALSQWGAKIVNYWSLRRDYQYSEVTLPDDEQGLMFIGKIKGLSMRRLSKPPKGLGAYIHQCWEVN